MDDEERIRRKILRRREMGKYTKPLKFLKNGVTLDHVPHPSDKFNEDTGKRPEKLFHLLMPNHVKQTQAMKDWVKFCEDKLNEDWVEHIASQMVFELCRKDCPICKAVK